MTEIKDIAIQVPGLTEDAGRELGRMVAGRLAAAMPTVEGGRHIETLDVQLTLSPTLSLNEMSEAIANRILYNISLGL